MTFIALQAPAPAPVTRAERPTPSAHALPMVQTVAAVPDQPSQGLSAGMAGFRDRARDALEQQQNAGYGARGKDVSGPQPFSALRFADPLPNLPELDLPAKKAAYHAALNVVRGPEPA